VSIFGRWLGDAPMGAASRRWSIEESAGGGLAGGWREAGELRQRRQERLEAVGADRDGDLRDVRGPQEARGAERLGEQLGLVPRRGRVADLTAGGLGGRRDRPDDDPAAARLSAACCASAGSPVVARTSTVSDVSGCVGHGSLISGGAEVLPSVGGVGAGVSADGGVAVSVGGGGVDSVGAAGGGVVVSAGAGGAELSFGVGIGAGDVEDGIGAGSVRSGEGAPADRVSVGAGVGATAVEEGVPVGISSGAGSGFVVGRIGGAPASYTAAGPSTVAT
jgi:hypothetical protein